MTFAEIDSPAAAFAAGLVTSLHCAGMCGPLACWLTPTKAADDATTVYTVYHGTRIFAYGVLGAVVGVLGQGPMTLLGDGVLSYAPWALVIFFIAVAFRWDRKLPRFKFLTGCLIKVQEWLRGRSRLTTAAVLGLATPLMPCGPLYLVAALAALTGSALQGAEFMLAFGLGTMPLLWAVQANFGWLRLRLSPVWIRRLQIVLAIAAALLISWRLRGTLGFGDPGVAGCCH